MHARKKLLYKNCLHTVTAQYCCYHYNACAGVHVKWDSWLNMDQMDGTLITLSSGSERNPLIINDSHSESAHYQSPVLTPATAQARFNDVQGHQLPLVTIVFIIVASIPALLVGCTVGFPSAALLDLQELETNPQYKFDTVLSDVFAVNESIIAMSLQAQLV